MAYNCPDDKNNVSANQAEALNKIPLLRYQKDPVLHKDDLWIKYPQGGEYGWYAFVMTAATFAYWDIHSKDWKLLSAGDLQTILGADVELLKEGDIPVWDASKEKFVIISLDVIGTEDY